MTFNATIYVKTVGAGTGSALLFIYNDPYNKLVDWEFGGGESYQAYPGETIDFLPNTLYVVREMTTAYGHLPYELGLYDPSQDSGSADAYVDPTFALTGQMRASTISKGCRTAPWRAAFPSPPPGRCY